MPRSDYQRKEALFGLGAIEGYGAYQAAQMVPKAMEFLTGANTVAGLAEKIKALTPTGRALNKAYHERGLANSASAKILEMSQNFKALGINPQDAASVAKAYESSVKAQQATHELERANSLIGRFSKSTAGQLSIPVLAMGAVSGGALAARKMMNVLGAAGVNVDPSARIAARVGVDRVIQAKPELGSYPRQQVESIYMNIFNHSPELAKDPFTMATTIERVLQMGGADTSVLKDLSEYQKSVGQPERDQADLFQMGNSIFRR